MQHTKSRQEITKELIALEWEHDEDGIPFRLLHYGLDGKQSDKKTYITFTDLVTVCEHFANIS